MHRPRALFAAAVWRKHQEAPRHKTNRTIIVDLGQRRSRLFYTSVDYGSETPAAEVRIQVPPLRPICREKRREKPEDRRRGSTERQAGPLQLSRSAAFGKLGQPEGNCP